MAGFDADEVFRVLDANSEQPAEPLLRIYLESVDDESASALALAVPEYNTIGPNRTGQ